MWRAVISWAGVLGLAGACPGQVTLESLLHEMADRDRPARWPDPEYRCAQASSYDRESTDPDNRATWFANDDRSYFIRVNERDGRHEYLMLDQAGPGAIVRFWGTWHGAKDQPFSNGTLRVYLDRNDEPVIEGPIADVLSGGLLAPAPISEFESPTCPPGNRAHNLYLPIPYAEHCLVTYETDAPIDPGATRGGEALYYQINYRTYAPGTRVESFTHEQLETLRPLLKSTAARLAGFEPGGLMPISASADENVAPGESVVLTLSGSGAVRELMLRVTGDDQMQALRSTVVLATFDGERTVCCPADAFFGCGYMGDEYSTWRTSCAGDGTMTSRWVMPYQRSCTLEFRNVSDAPMRINAIASASSWDWDERSMHFGASWWRLERKQTLPLHDLSGTHAEDVNFVTLHGRGVLVGDELGVFNGAAAWWGEGDEKIYVDGEAFPSHFGTGTEDYYGYAWCRPEPFSSAFHAQPRGEGNFNPGYSVNLRQRSLDAVPFTQNLRFDMELWHWTATKINYEPAVFWYARPGVMCSVDPAQALGGGPVARTREDVVPIRRVPGAIEGESMRISEPHVGVVEMQDIPQFEWSGSKQLWWRDGEPGDLLKLTFSVEHAGRYRVIADLTSAVDYAVVQLSIDGRSVGPVIDVYGQGVTHREYELDTMALAAGEHTLGVTIVGANDKAVPRHMFGLDYLRLEPVR